MTSPQTKYFTTPIYYVNGDAHIGTAYTTLAADTLARYWRAQLGPDNVRFLTGTDENSQKTIDAAAAAGLAVGPYLNQMAQRFRDCWDTLGIAYDDFIRTTEPRHHHHARALLQKMYDQGDIYAGEYVGLYCTGCESFLKENELDEHGHCPHHQRPPQQIKEQNYFFRLSKYSDQIIALLEGGLIQPESRKNELLAFVRAGLEDISISREGAQIGISCPWDESHKVYVWTEALINYYSAIADTPHEHFWPSAIHLMGKDITRFHAVIWPALLLSAGLPVPQLVFGHGFFTVDGTKMSKSLGNVIEPLTLSEKYGNDAVRVGLLSAFEFGNDGDFSQQTFHQLYQTKLAGGIGNLFHRVITLVNKYYDGVKPTTDLPAEVKSHTDTLKATYHRAFTDYKLKTAIDTLFAVVDTANQHLNDTEPWKAFKVDPEATKDIFTVQLHYLTVITELAAPLLPEAHQTMHSILQPDQPTVTPSQILYARLDTPA